MAHLVQVSTGKDWRCSACREAQRTFRAELTPTSDACECLRPTIRVTQKQVISTSGPARLRVNGATRMVALGGCLSHHIGADVWADFISSSQHTIPPRFRRAKFIPRGHQGPCSIGFSLRSLHHLSALHDLPDSQATCGTRSTVSPDQRKRSRYDCRGGYGRKANLQQPFVSISARIFT